MYHLRAIGFAPSPKPADVYPFNLPAFQSSPQITFAAPVTFFAGENGTGKSTLLEALAYAIGAHIVGSEDVHREKTLTSVRQLADRLQLSWHIKTRNGFFLRAEDFFGYIKRLTRMEAELKEDIQRIDHEYAGRSDMAKGLAKLPYARELHAIREQYGRDLSTYSHGESFLELFQSRFRPKSLYLLDEPEAPLSPLRQLTLLSMIKQMAAQQCQFIIATHSPILMAFPGATILSFDYTPLQAVVYEELEHVTVTRSFLNNPEQYLRHL